MKTFVVAAISLLTLPVLPPGAAAAEFDSSSRALVEREATAFLASYLDILQGEDPEAIRGLYAQEGRLAWFTDGEKRYASADEVIASLASMEGTTLSTETSDLEVIGLAPHLVHARSAFHTKLSQGGAVVYEFSGVITWLLEKDAGGSWRVLTGHTSTPKTR